MYSFLCLFSETTFRRGPWLCRWCWCITFPSHPVASDNIFRDHADAGQSKEWAQYRVIIVAAKPPKPSKIALRLKSLLTKFLCVKTVSDNVIKYSLSLAYISVQKWWETSPSTWKFSGYWSNPFAKRRYLIYFRCASAVTTSKKSLINTNRKSTTRFPVSLRWTSYVAPQSPKGGSNRKTAVFHVKSHSAGRKCATKWGDDAKSKCVALLLLTLIRSLV